MAGLIYFAIILICAVGAVISILQSDWVTGSIMSILALTIYDHQRMEFLYHEREIARRMAEEAMERIREVMEEEENTNTNSNTNPNQTKEKSHD